MKGNCGSAGGNCADDPQDIEMGNYKGNYNKVPHLLAHFLIQYDFFQMEQKMTT